MRIDILVSVLPESINDLENSIEENNLKNAIAEVIKKQGYHKFTVVGSDEINEKTKKRVVLD